MSLHQLKALIYGALAATDLVSPTRIVDCLWIGGKAPILTYDQLESLVGNTLAIWKDFASLPDRTPYPLASLPIPVSVHGLVKHTRVREEEMLFFTRGMDLGTTDLSDLTPRAVQALTALSGASGLLKQLPEIAENQPAPPPETVSSTLQHLQEMDFIIATEMAVVLDEQKQTRIAKLNRHASPKEPDRNSLCPCGSGRKYKRCCGKRA